ncbi:MAG: hypothetical protein MK165_13990 [Pirellulaceae bacterium]|nr:hypothetical protein [Pirellulaceae bacterium]
MNKTCNSESKTMIDMTNIYDVELKMVDELRGTEVVRVIDKGNAMTSGEVCWELRGEVEQREALEEWIRDRGNEQHETLLRLVSWKFV